MEIRIIENNEAYFQLAMDEFRNQVENAVQNQDDRSVTLVLEFKSDEVLFTNEVVAESYIDYDSEDLKYTRITRYSNLAKELGIN